MIRIFFVLCEALGDLPCEEAVLEFEPLQPIACIHAAGPELDRLARPGWFLASWRCLEPLSEPQLAED